MSEAAARPPSFLPRTFLEWGVAVPFTTPMLSSSRIRPGRRGRPEMLMPNPSGGRGLYVFDLAAAPEVTSLTLHDRLLLERLLDLPAPAPADIRKAAQEVAIEGAAGRRAAREANAAADLDSSMSLLIQFHLVTRLLVEAGQEQIDWRQCAGDDRELRATIKAALGSVAPQLGIPVDGLFEEIEAIAGIASPVGPPGDTGAARNEMMLARLRTFTLSLRQWSAGETGVAAADAAAVLALGERALAEADTAQGEARAVLEDVARLLRGWRQRAGEAMRSALTRPEWLLDGWGQICGMWEAAVREERARQRETLEQIRAALPMLDPNDREHGLPADPRDFRFDRGRRVRLHEDWRTGLSVMEGRARAELLRAASA